MTKQINWGIIGCGNVTEIKSGPAFNKVNDSKLVAVMRRDGEKAKDYAARHKVPFWYDNADKLINDPKVNAVYIATPPGSHAEYAIRAMRAGKPVYVEKPMAANYSECLEMNKVSMETGIPLFVAYYRRKLPGFLKVKDLIDSGAIGKPLFFSIRFFTAPQQEDFQKQLPWRVIPELSGGGYIFDMGSHQLDFIDYILGPVEEVSALSFNQANLYAPDDFTSASFRCAGGVMGNATWNFVAPEHLREDSIEISGTKGTIRFSCFEFTPISLKTGDGIKYFENERPQHVQQRLIESIVADLQGTGTCPSTGVTASRTSRLLDLVAGKNIDIK